MYKRVLKITKETWEKCGIKTVKHCNEKEDVTELWPKVSDLETHIKHSNICDVSLKRIINYFEKKNKRRYRRKKTKIQSIFLN